MPILQAKTLQSKETWRSDDGKVTAYEVLLDVNGDQFKTQTYSRAISQIGWSGEVESYEKNGKTMVRQPQREGSSYGGGKPSFQKPAYSKPEPKSDFTMYLSYAKDIYVALINNGGVDPSMDIKALFADILKAGNQLYAARPDAPTPAIDHALVNGGDIIIEDLPTGNLWEGLEVKELK